MVFLAGVDEAGYGPLLGPFVVGYSLFRVPDTELDLWQVTQEATAQKPARKDRRIRIDDSKRVHSGPLGRGRLERAVAAFLALQPDPHYAELSEWIERPPSGDPRWFHSVPWYSDLSGPLCTQASTERAELDAGLLARGLEAGGCALEAIGARAVPAGEWNALNEQWRSKGETLFQVTATVIRHLLEITGDAPLRIELDRHGARSRYGPRLEAALSPKSIEIHGEQKGGSAYTLSFERRAVQLRFSEEADRQHYSVALASLAAKQTREELMDRWNRWFGARLDDVRPTRGYATDGRRWLEASRPRLQELGIEWERLVRKR